MNLNHQLLDQAYAQKVFSSVLISGILLLCFSPSNSSAKAGELDLAQAATQKGTVTTLTSTLEDPLGIEGLWGLEALFIVNHGCQASFDALRAIEHYPLYSDKVKRVEVLERAENSLLVHYTEGAWGFETTTTMQWAFQPEASPLKMTTLAVGEKDPPSWMQVSFIEVDAPNYCQLKLVLFADTSWMPQFVLSWISPMAAEELATTYRDIIAGSTAQKESK